MYQHSKLNYFLAATLLAALSVSISQAAEPNDDFSSATVLPAGTLSVTDSLEGSLGLAPDTYLGFFADDTFSPPPLEEDDDSSPLGDGLAAALFDVSVNADGSIPLAVTGCCDGFDGSHGEEGDYELFVDVFDVGGSLIDAFTVTSTLMAGVVDEFPFSDPAWIGGTFDAVIDNTVGVAPGVDPLDFWVFTGLVPGAPYVAEVTAGDFDSILASLTSGGAIADVDDDSGDGLLSQLEVTATPSGELFLAVTGFADFDLLGIHPEFGDYELTVSIVPEPGSMTLILLGLAAIGATRRL